MLIQRFGFSIAVIFVQLFALQTGQLPKHIFRQFIDLENRCIKRRNIEKYEKENKSKPELKKEFEDNQEFMKYFNEYEKNGWAALGFESSE